MDTLLNAASIPYCIRDISVMFWAKEDPNFMVKLEHNPPHVMLWAGVTATCLIHPYFFDGLVYITFFTEMLRHD